MATLFAIAISVVGSIIAHYIIKWLNRYLLR